jgi:hypothetical protein
LNEQTADRNGAPAVDPTLPTSLRQRLDQLVETSAAAREVAEFGRQVYTPAGLDLFLSTPMAVFDGRTGLELLEAGEAESVLAALAADYEGLGF